MEKADGPASSHQNLVVIGRDSRGNWVAQESRGLFGGMFVSRAQAVKYALFENGPYPATLVLSSDVVELDLHSEPRPRTKAAGNEPRVLAA